MKIRYTYSDYISKRNDYVNFYYILDDINIYPLDGYCKKPLIPNL